MINLIHYLKPKKYFSALVVLAAINPSLSTAQTAASISFDDSATGYVAGSDVQAALESVDSALSGVDANASVVRLMKDCTGVANCFTTTAALTDWLWQGGRTQVPSEGDAVSVQMGAGDFEPFECSGVGNGWVSVTGAGREVSRFIRSTPGGITSGACHGAIHVNGCTNLEFGNLGAKGNTGVYWIGAGSGKWWNVDMLGETTYACGGSTFGWYDLPGQPAGRAEQYMFGVRAMAHAGSTQSFVNNFALEVTSTDLWFYGGDVVASPKSGVAASNVGVFASGDVVARFFGTTIRADVGNLVDHPFPGGLFFLDSGQHAVFVKNGAQFHIHGGIVRADAQNSTVAQDVTAISTELGLVHTPDTAFVVFASPAGGEVSRVKNRAPYDPAHPEVVPVIMSPYLWPASDTPPAAATLHGDDMFVDKASGAGSDEAHLMIFDASCTGGGGSWRDMATNTCR